MLGLAGGVDMNEWRQRGCQMKTVYHKEVGRGVACGTTRVGCSTVSEMSLEGRSATYTKDDAPEVKLTRMSLGE